MLDKYIAKQIVLAQIASDGGKRQNDVLKRVTPLLPISRKYYKKGYKNKDHCIMEAIKVIQKNPNTGFHYHVKVDRTLYSGAHVFIVYFNFKINGESYQVSFHCFSNMWRFVNKHCVTRWKKKHSSKEAVIKLAYYLFNSNEEKDYGEN